MISHRGIVVGETSLFFLSAFLIVVYISYSIDFVCIFACFTVVKNTHQIQFNGIVSSLTDHVEVHMYLSF